ncbi:hypothetical protein J6590_054979 [Homalodisca vitripennis]|nr:hypothetical protein J6590_054979 [Homalodisca vitripennis]
MCYRDFCQHARAIVCQRCELLALPLVGEHCTQRPLYNKQVPIKSASAASCSPFHLYVNTAPSGRSTTNKHLLNYSLHWYSLLVSNNSEVKQVIEYYSEMFSLPALRAARPSTCT